VKKLSRAHSVFLATILVVTVATGKAALGLALKAPSRVVAVGDVHGAYEGFVSILQVAGLVDDDARWIGGDATLVQTGDLMDRGARVRDVLDLMIRLEQEAPRQGGRVVSLLGNHEIFNMLGFYDPKSTPQPAYQEVLDSFADEDPEKRRREAYKQWKRWGKRYPGCAEMTKEEWMADHPLGYVEYIEAVGATGKYGKWLRERPVAARIDDAVFVHGGFSPKLEAMGIDSLEDINRRVHEEFDRFDREREFLVAEGIGLPFFTPRETLCSLDSEIFRRSEDGEEAEADPLVNRLQEIRSHLPSLEWLSLNDDGPLWFRGFAHWSDEEGEAELGGVLERFGARHFVVGHTPQPGAIKMRFEGAVFLIDTALVFGPEAEGIASALEVKEGVFSVIYLEDRAVLWDGNSGPRVVGEESALPREPRWRGPEGEPLPFTDPVEVEGFLRTADIVSVEDIPLGITKPKKLVLERDGVRSQAAYRYFHEEIPSFVTSSGRVIRFFRDSYVNEVAAYETARLLGLENLPPVVLRTVDGVAGSVQLWVEDAMMERERRENRILPPAEHRVRFHRQLQDMRVFDNLIGNFDRNQGNMLIDKEWNLWLIDHTRSFRWEKSLPEPGRVRRCSHRLWRALNELDTEELEQRLRPHLDKKAIQGVLVRRERLIRLLNEKIAEQGEERVLFSYSDPDDAVRVINEETALTVANEGV
jgi:hypothetical protein